MDIQQPATLCGSHGKRQSWLAPATGLDVPVYYQDPLVTIINADAREVMHKIPRGLVVTDPPYNVGYHYDGYDDKMDTDEYQAMLRETCRCHAWSSTTPRTCARSAWTLEEIPERDGGVGLSEQYGTPMAQAGIGPVGLQTGLHERRPGLPQPNDKHIAERIARGERARLYDWWEVNQVKTWQRKDRTSLPDTRRSDDANNQNHRLPTCDRPVRGVRHDTGGRKTARHPVHRNRAQPKILPNSRKPRICGDVARHVKRRTERQPPSMTTDTNDVRGGCSLRDWFSGDFPRVPGQMPADDFHCAAPISAGSGEGCSRTTDLKNGLAAHTEFRVVRRLPDGTNLLEARPLTGRTNQIRVHLWHLGFPVCGDSIYLPGQKLGHTQTLAVGEPPLCLHAARVRFLHPLSLEPVEFNAPLPAWAK